VNLILLMGFAKAQPSYEASTEGRTALSPNICYNNPMLEVEHIEG